MASHISRVCCTKRVAEATGVEEHEVKRQDDELHGSTSYLSMLHDTARNEAYDVALRSMPPASVVLDLGAGTGLLSLLACRAQHARAVACEIYGACASLAVRVVHENGMSDRVTVVQKAASDLELSVDLSEPADLCVFELFDSQLLGEGILPILRDAHARLLKPGATLVPCAARVYGVLVECDVAAADLPELRGAPWPMMLGQLGLFDGGSTARPLSAVVCLAEIDFVRLPDVPAWSVTELEVRSPGTVHAVAWWWELDMGNGGKLSSWTPSALADGNDAARHHWRPCLSFLQPRHVVVGRESIVTVHDDEALWFAWHRTDESVPPRWIEGITAVPPERERLLMASRREWTMPLRRAVVAAGRRLVLLPGHDGLLLPLLAEAFVDTHPGGRALVVLSKRVLQRLQDAGRLPDCVELTTSEGLRGNEDPVVLEPFAAAADPWSLIADTAKRLAPFTNVAFPSAASVMAVLVECQGTWLARQPLAKVCGLDLSVCNACMVPQENAPLDCHLCEVAWRSLSGPETILRIDVGRVQGPWCGQNQLHSTATGTCHAVAFWVDFDGASGSLTTGPPPPGGAPTGWTQALHMLHSPMDVSSGKCFSVHVELSQGGHPRIVVGALEKRRKVN